MVEFVKEILKKDYKCIIISFIISLVLTITNFKRLGIKDSFIIFVATFFLLYEIYLLTKNKKYSMLLYILTFPVMVTSRKLVYCDLLIIKVTYETIYITLLFLSNIKDITRYLEQAFKQHTLRAKFLILIFIFLIFSYNSVIYSPNTIMSLCNVYISVTIPIMFLLSALVLFEKRDKYIIYYDVITAIDLSCLYGMFQIVMNGISIKNIKLNRNLLTFGYNNINIFAGILVITIPLLLEIILYKKSSKRERILQIVSFFIYLISLFITYSRGAWICFLLSVFLILISKKYKKILIAFSAVILAALKPLSSYILSRGYSNFSILNNLSVTARIQSFFTDFIIMKKYPFGIGIGNFADQYKKFVVDGYMSIPQNIRYNMMASGTMLENAHNLLMQIGVELGIVSLIVFVMIFINRFKVIFQNYNLNRGMFVSLVIYLIFSEVTGNELSHKGVLTGTLIIFLIFALIEMNNKDIKKDVL